MLLLKKIPLLTIATVLRDRHGLTRSIRLTSSTITSRVPAAARYYRHGLDEKSDFLGFSTRITQTPSLAQKTHSAKPLDEIISLGYSGRLTSSVPQTSVVKGSS
jgi:hypothetical protein